MTAVGEKLPPLNGSCAAPAGAVEGDWCSVPNTIDFEGKNPTLLVCIEDIANSVLDDFLKRGNELVSSNVRVIVIISGDVLPFYSKLVDKCWGLKFDISPFSVTEERFKDALLGKDRGPQFIYTNKEGNVVFRLEGKDATADGLKENLSRI